MVADITVVVLAGGQSTRMGTDKAMLHWAGQRLVHHVQGRIAEGCREILVASGDGHRLGLPGEIADAIPDAGPLSGALTGFEKASYPLVALVAVDMPYASADVLQAFAAVMDDADAVVGVVDGRRHPLHALYRKEVAGELRDYLESGERSARGFLDTLQVIDAGPDVWSAADPTGTFAVNLNWPSDLPQ